MDEGKVKWNEEGNWLINIWFTSTFDHIYLATHEQNMKKEVSGLVGWTNGFGYINNRFCSTFDHAYLATHGQNKMNEVSAQLCGDGIG